MANLQVLWDQLTRCAELHGNNSASEVLQVWQEDRASAASSENFLGAAVFTLATAALQGRTLLEREDSICGVEMCLGLAAENLDAAAQQRLAQTVLERTLRRLDETGAAIATQASTNLLKRALLTTAKECTQSLRALLALLFRCVGERVSAQELLELTEGDVALAVAVLAEALAARSPAGLGFWPLRLCTMLQQLTSPDIFTWLLQRADPDLDFNQLPMADFRAKQIIHCQVIALSYVQFDVLGRALAAAEDQAQRQKVLAALIRALHSLVGSCDLVGPGRLLSRCMSMDFMRLGFRFIAPLGRKLIEDGARDSARVRQLCRTFSWLLVHSDFDGNPFLRDSMKPVAAEWLMRARKRGDIPSKALLALAILLANTGADANGLEDVLECLTRDHYLDFPQELHRWGAFTEKGVEILGQLGYYVTAAGDLEVDSEEEEEDIPGLVDVGWHLEPPLPAPPEDGQPCHECGKASEEGQYGEGYFDGLWYCIDCWDSWRDASPEMVTISPWPLEAGEEEAPEQRGSAQMLLRAPGTLRCGISGMLMMDPVYIPGSQVAHYPVAFSRRSLEKWHRRSKGRCPITGDTLDLKDATDATEVTAAVIEWLDVGE